MALLQIQRKYSKFIFDSCKNSSKFGLPTNRTHQSDPISRNSTFQKKFYFKNREYDDQGRFYFKNRAYHHDQGHWFHNPKRVGLTLFFFTCGALIGVSYGKWVTVPYTERSHFVLFHELMVKPLPDEPTTDEDKLLPPLHPDSIMARRIFLDIIDQALPIEMEMKRALHEKQNDYEERANCDIVIFDWVRDHIAGSSHFGKIYVTSAFLDHYKDHQEMLATIFGSEVGHVLARHNQELLSKLISLVSGIGMSFYLFSKSAYVRSKMPYLDTFMRLRFIPSISLVATVPMLSYVLMRMYHRRMEIEADHIGLMLAASAGYNPEVGVLYPVYGDELNQTVLPEWLSLFPSGRTRNRYLARPQVLDEAISRYRQSTKPSGTTDST